MAAPRKGQHDPATRLRAMRALRDADFTWAQIGAAFGLEGESARAFFDYHARGERLRELRAGRDAPAAAGQPSPPGPSPAAHPFRDAGHSAPPSPPPRANLSPKMGGGGATRAAAVPPPAAAGEGCQPCPEPAPAAIPPHLAAIVAAPAHRCPRTGRAPTPREAAAIWEGLQRRKAQRRGASA